MFFQNFRLKFRFLRKNSDFQRKFHVWPTFQFLTFDVWLKFVLLTRISMWPKFRLLTRTSTYHQNVYFRIKFKFVIVIQISDEISYLTKISIFDQNFDFWPKFRFLTKISIFVQNFDIWLKNRFLIKLFRVPKSTIVGPKFWLQIKNFSKNLFDQNYYFRPKSPFLPTIWTPN